VPPPGEIAVECIRRASGDQGSCQELRLQHREHRHEADAGEREDVGGAEARERCAVRAFQEAEMPVQHQHRQQPPAGSDRRQGRSAGKGDACPHEEAACPDRQRLTVRARTFASKLRGALE
jgi:hypothetical protein